MMDDKPLIDIVEDDEAMSRALKSLVESMGYSSRSFVTAPQYLADDASDGPDCLILDVRLPGMSGLDLQARLVERGGAPPIIFITGHADAHASDVAEKRGAAAFLEKPFSSRDLAGAIRQAILAAGEE